MTNNPAQLRSAAAALVTAAEMLEHNDAIFKGKWKKGSKAWSGDFIERTVQEGLAPIISAHDMETMRAALSEIAKGEGPFSTDPLTHASNVINAMKKLARDALRGVK